MYKDQFRGYDPYDLAEASISLPHFILSKLSFVNKVSPVNFRNLLGILPTDNAKSNGLWLWAYALDGIEKHSGEISYLLDWIEKNKATDFDEFSMGFTFRMALSRYASEPGKTSLIISLFIVFPLIELYKKQKDPKLLEKIESFENLLEYKWLKYEDETILWYSYLPERYDEVYNATAKVGKFYSLLHGISAKPKYKEKIFRILKYLSEKQNCDGSWGYSVNSSYVDNFHSAFVLDSIFHMRKVVDNDCFERMFVTGLNDYLQNCFDNDLRPLHFHKKHKPLDIRSRILETEIRDCANAIILFSKLGMKGKASGVLNWTNKFLLDPKRNYYYFYKNKLFSNKINFVRWQAWMALAIAEYNVQ
ncbi:hypothetical protein [uncultured Sunxiuqinia sp.]|uniref:hypothetical protein n=1 Tax=uncultured Sunxiuqinia sp. TaxID=1573825 RepID=UPI002AA65B45|nr:hypothetical protein [uncultured Sunxiuqinia sp.]